MNEIEEGKKGDGRGNSPFAAAQINILLVEDERFVREVAAEILEEIGYRVLKAKSSNDAIKVFRRNGAHIDLLITDVVLPGKNGCGLSDELEVECPELKTIFISGYPEQAINLADQANRASYLAKPFSVESLTSKVREALEARPRAIAGWRR